MKKIIAFISFCFLCINVISQSLSTTNIHYRTIDNKIEIYYDLPKNRDSLSVKIIFYKKSDPKFKYHPKYITGVVGIGLFSGINKKITWYFKKEPAWVFTGSGFYFKVIAVKISKKYDTP
jgi:hypothetical protein